MMTDMGEIDGYDPTAAGPVGPWITELRAAIAGTGSVNVPCGSCTACCRSSQFIEIGPEEHHALRRIPRELLFPAPRRPKGHQVMGFDQQGHCPMLVNNACSIYEDRPQTCRTYDCRVFAATGVHAAADGKAAIHERSSHWVFDATTDRERVSLVAMATAARYLHKHRSAIGDQLVPSTATHVAVAAFELHELFMKGSAGAGPRFDEPSTDEVRRALLGLRSK